MRHLWYNIRVSKETEVCRVLDLHCHVLYHIDDGPDTLYESVRLCEMAVDNGIEGIAATSHLYSCLDAADYVRRRDDRLERLREELQTERMPLHLYAGAEVFIDEDITHARDLDRVTLNNSRYLLIEFAFRGLSARRLLYYIDTVYKMDLTPVVAHPERYSFLQQDHALVDYLVQRGVIFQINADSLAGRTGYEEFDLAYRMVRHNAASVIATDAHSHLSRTNDLLRMIRDFPPDIPRESLDYMLYRAPAAILADKPLPPIRRSSLQRVR